MDLNCRNITNKNKNSDKNLFIKDLSLEIVNTLNGLDGFLCLFDEEELSERNKELLAQSKYATFLLSHQIDSLNYIQEEESICPQINYHVLSLYDMLINSLNFFKNKYYDKNIKVDFYYDNNIPKELCGDSIKLNEVLNSLLENVFLFVKEKIDISVSVITLDENAKTVKFEFCFDRELELENQKEGEENLALKTNLKKFNMNLAISCEILNQLESQLVFSNENDNKSKFIFDLMFL